MSLWWRNMAHISMSEWSRLISAVMGSMGCLHESLGVAVLPRAQPHSHDIPIRNAWSGSCPGETTLRASDSTWGWYSKTVEDGRGRKEKVLFQFRGNSTLDIEIQCGVLSGILDHKEQKDTVGTVGERWTALGWASWIGLWACGLDGGMKILSSWLVLIDWF